MKKSDNYIDTIFFEDVPTFNVTSKCVKNGNTGNVIAYGRLDGNYKKKE